MSRRRDSKSFYFFAKVLLTMRYKRDLEQHDISVTIGFFYVTHGEKKNILNRSYNGYAWWTSLSRLFYQVLWRVIFLQFRRYKLENWNGRIKFLNINTSISFKILAFFVDKSFFHFFVLLKTSERTNKFITWLFDMEKHHNAFQSHYGFTFFTSWLVLRACPLPKVYTFF